MLLWSYSITSRRTTATTPVVVPNTYLQWLPLYPVVVPTYSDDHCTQWWYLPVVVTTVPSGGTYLLW